MAPKGRKNKKNASDQAEAVSPTGDAHEDEEHESSEGGSPTDLRTRLRELMREKAESDAELAILKETVKLTKEKGVTDDLIRKAAWVRQWDSVRTRVRTTLNEVKEELEGMDQCATESLLDKLNRDWHDSEVSYNALLPYADEQEFHAKLSRCTSRPAQNPCKSVIKQIRKVDIDFVTVYEQYYFTFECQSHD